jgi:hypothetical protein
MYSFQRISVVGGADPLPSNGKVCAIRRLGCYGYRMRAWMLLALVELSCLPQTRAASKEQYFGPAAVSCARDPAKGLGLLDASWADLLQSVGQQPLITGYGTRRSLTVYRVAVLTTGYDQVPAHFQPLEAVVALERDGASAPRLRVIRNNPRTSSSAGVGEEAWGAVDGCWRQHPVEYGHGAGCQELAAGLVGGGIANWVLLETLRDGRYDVADLWTFSLLHTTREADAAPASDAPGIPLESPPSETIRGGAEALLSNALRPTICADLMLRLAGLAP